MNNHELDRICSHCNHEVEPLVTNILENYGSNGVVIEDSNDLINQPTDKFGEIYELKRRLS